MAQIRLQPPDPFDFRNPEDWPRWRRRFQQFREASGLGDETSASKQISTFLYCLGEEAESVLASTNATAEDRGDFDRTIAKFDGYFQVRKNVIYERARFNRRSQQSGETADQYIMALYALSEHCDYGTMTAEMIRDRLVVGIRDTAMSEKLQMDSALTLESAKKAIRQREAVHEQQLTLNGGSKANKDIDAVHSQRGKQMHFTGRHRSERRESRPSPHNNAPTGDKCSRCGRERHSREKCPARDAQCHNCKRKGHYSALCRQRVVSTIQEGDTPDSAFLDTVTGDTKNTWSAHVAVNGKQLPFKLDTGAEVTAVSKEAWETLGKPALQTPRQQLFGPDKNPLEVSGQFQCHLAHRGKETHQQVFVVDHLQRNLLGLPAITALQLAIRMDSLETTTTEGWRGSSLNSSQGWEPCLETTTFSSALMPSQGPFTQHVMFRYHFVPKSLRNWKGWRGQA